ncbi:MAG: M24 family metallopeptidase [Enterobacteriaceae bacterium]
MFMLIDAGCEYCAMRAISPTFPVNKIHPAARFTIVLASLETALGFTVLAPPFSRLTSRWCIMITGLVRSASEKDVDELMENNAHRPYFMHGLSHWLGLDVHDVGCHDVDRSRLLEPGMVLTVEPGLYIAADADVPPQYRSIGVRIEDDIVITEDGNETSPRRGEKPTILRR